MEKVGSIIFVVVMCIVGIDILFEGMSKHTQTAVTRSSSAIVHGVANIAHDMTTPAKPSASVPPPVPELSVTFSNPYPDELKVELVQGDTATFPANSKESVVLSAPIAGYRNDVGYIIAKYSLGKKITTEKIFEDGSRVRE